MPRGRGSTPSTNASASRRAAASHQHKTFDEYYSAIFDRSRKKSDPHSLGRKGRWAALVKAMSMPAAKVALWNKYCGLPLEEVAAEAGLVAVDFGQTLKLLRPSAAVALDVARKQAVAAGAPEVPSLPFVTGPNGLELDPALTIPPPPRDAHGTPAYYILDLASALVAEQLQVEPFSKVLDMCAAPGGKSIAICQFLAPSGELTSNEPVADRMHRLRRNIMEFVPPDVTGLVGLQVVQRDATRWYQPGAFDRVLLDAPCSSERHLVEHGIAVGESATAAAVASKHGWTDLYSVEMAQRQTELLLRAIETVKVGGRIVYSTCSISPLENDGVVEAAVRKTRCGVKVLPTQLALGGETTKFGWIVLPDVCDGWGPMFCATLTKTSELKSLSDSDEDDESENSDE